jgi:hypothetical protein
MDEGGKATFQTDCRRRYSNAFTLKPQGDVPRYGRVSLYQIAP